MTARFTSRSPEKEAHEHSEALRLQEGRSMTSTAFTDPQVLHCLADYLLHHEPASAHALHQTCRAAASAVQQAVSALSVVAQHVDIVHSVHTFSGLSQLKCTQCSLTCQVCVLLPRNVPICCRLALPGQGECTPFVDGALCLCSPFFKWTSP